jgi:hypothetical protein
MKVTDIKYPVTIESIHTIFSRIGPVEKIVVRTKPMIKGNAFFIATRMFVDV